jgi:hypothetical protein
MTSVAPPAALHPQAEAVGEAVAPVAPADRAAQVAVVAAAVAVAALAASDDLAVGVAGAVVEEAAEERHRPARCQPMPVWCRPTAPAWPVHCPRED